MVSLTNNKRKSEKKKKEQATRGEVLLNLILVVILFWPYQGLNENKSLEKDISKQQGTLNRTLGWEPGVLGSYSSSVSNKP